MSRPVRRAHRVAAPCTPEDWQVGRNTQSCNEHMFEKQLCCDVMFEAGVSKTKIGAHRYILISRSPVFLQMFHNKPQSAEIIFPLQDSAPEAVKSFLRFLYTDMPALSAETVTGVLFLSQQYRIGALLTHCVDFIKSKLAVDNACWYLHQAHIYQEKELFQHCLKYVLANGDSVLKSAYFLSLGQDLVDHVISQDGLQAEERTVYERVLEWTKAEAGRRNIIAVDWDTIRGILGQSLYHIRFPRLNISYFACVIAQESLLTDTEKVTLFRYFAKADNTANPFNTKMRRAPLQQGSVGIHTKSCVRFLRTIGPLDCPFDDVIDANRNIAISFSSTRNIQLSGFLLFQGTKLQYNVRVKLYSGEANLLHEESVSITNYNNNTNDMTRVELATPVNLYAKSVYTLNVLTSSPNLYYGIDGQMKVEIPGSESFLFYESPIPDCSTSLSHGDLPGLLYHVL